MDSLTDEDFKRTVRSALRLMAVATAVVGPLVWWKMGWQSAVQLLVGAAISGSGLYEWLRLMTAVMVRMDGGEKARPMGLVLAGFFLRLGLTVVVLYVSLKGTEWFGLRARRWPRSGCVCTLGRSFEAGEGVDGLGRPFEDTQRQEPEQKLSLTFLYAHTDIVCPVSESPLWRVHDVHAAYAAC